MTDTPVTFPREYILLEEEVEYSLMAVAGSITTWTASAYGPLSTGEHINMTRTAGTHQAALEALEAALSQNGWTIA